MMQDDSLFHPWECKGLDPFRDDPVASDSELGYDDIEEAKSDDLEVGAKLASVPGSPLRDNWREEGRFGGFSAFHFSWDKKRDYYL